MPPGLMSGRIGLMVAPGTIPSRPGCDHGPHTAHGNAAAWLKAVRANPRGCARGVWFLAMADPSSSPHAGPGEPLRKWERAVAMLIGTVLAGLAIWALFTSSNQAGTAALLLVAAAFLLIGVQGTA